MMYLLAADEHRNLSARSDAWHEVQWGGRWATAIFYACLMHSMALVRAVDV